MGASVGAVKFKPRRWHRVPRLLVRKRVRIMGWLYRRKRGSTFKVTVRWRLYKARRAQRVGFIRHGLPADIPF